MTDTKLNIKSEIDNIMLELSNQFDGLIGRTITTKDLEDQKKMQNKLFKAIKAEIKSEEQTRSKQ